MKAFSVGLETDVYLTSSEIGKLRNSKIEGISRFRECDEERTRKIPIRIIHDEEQRNNLEIITIPGNCYFGNAQIIIFMINNDFYRQLSDSGSYCRRFLTSGKLSISAEDK